MAIKKYYANKDNTISNAFKSNLTTRATGANMGLSDILETFSIYGQASTSSTELERILIQFPISEVSLDRTRGIIPAAGSVNFYLNMYNAPHNQTTPREMELTVLPVSSSWQEGTGLDMDNYKDTTNDGLGSNWTNSAANTPWATAGGDYLESPAYSQTFPVGNENLKIDITSLVERWIAGTTPNYGVGVHLTSSQEAYYEKFFPREAVQLDGQGFLSGSAAMPADGPSTISAWIKPTDSGALRYILFWQNIGGVSYSRAIFRATSQQLKYQRNFSGTNSWITSADTIPQDTWTHIAITHNQTAGGTPILYLNGTAATATTDAGPPTGTPNSFDMVAIGGSNAGSSTNFVGFVDDIAYYNKILTPTEITELYNSGCPANLSSLSTAADLFNWWVYGDDPRDEIKLGTPPTEASIFDRAGTTNLFATGSGNMTIVTGTCSGQNGTVPDNSGGQVTNNLGAKESYYTKKFFGRGSEFFFKRPTIEAVWDSSIKDDRGNFYASSSLLPAEENNRTVYLYNAIGGRLRNIPAVGTGEIYVKVYSSASAGDPLTPTAITGGYVSTGIYSASFSLDTTQETVYDRWFAAGLDTCYHTGTIEIKNHAAIGYSPYPNYVTNLTNLRSSYYTHETNRFKFYVRQKDWSPTIYTVASKKTDTLIIESGSYQIHRITDNLIAIPYNTGSDRGTEMSFDVSGNYFDLKMDLLEPGYSYGIKVAFYDETVDSYIEQPYMWKFRVEEV
jgi:hypothetical protein